MNDLSIILCTYNESSNIKQTLTQLTNRISVKEIIIIDDNSTDGTADIIRNFKNDKIKLFIRKETRGFASAYIFGILMSNGNYILRFDVDMYLEIEFFIDTFEKNRDRDCVIFSRYVTNGNDVRSAYRKISSLILNKSCK